MIANLREYQTFDAGAYARPKADRLVPMIRRTRREFLHAGAVGTASLQAQDGGRSNVLFVAVDDLRPDFGAYGNRQVHSPHLDRLAASGTLFTRAYCQQAVCSPSRTSLLTGKRPDTTRVYELQTHFRKTIPHAVTLPEHFKRNGYVTAGMGKIFHNGLDDPQSWSIAHWFPGPQTPPWNSPRNDAREKERWQRLQSQGLVLPTQRVDRAQRGPSWRNASGDDTSHGDGQVAETAIAALEKLQRDRFFLAVGFSKPHLPFVAPSKYFDLYAGKQFEAPERNTPPAGAPAMAFHTSGELRNYSDIPQSGPIPASQGRELRLAYYAALSYMDAQLGKVLGALERLNLANNTIVVLWGDHGYHLGDLDLWNKHTNFERAVWSPLIVRAPSRGRPGQRTNALTEFVDIYPSLSDLCGLPAAEGLEGVSFSPLLADPRRPWKRAAFSQYPRGKRMGYSMRTERWRYTEWREPDGAVAARELYDHAEVVDPSVNLAETPHYSDIRRRHEEWLRGGWQATRQALRRS